MKEETFIRNVAKRLNKQQCDLFVGSGISMESNFKSWKDLLEPVLVDIGIKIRKDDDFPLLAQYIANENVGNLNNLRRMLTDAYSDSNSPNEYHEILARYPVSTIWTTNYDRLLEMAFGHKKPKVIVDDRELMQYETLNRLQIIKLHGSIDSRPDLLVLTQSDYDDVLFKKRAIFEALRNALSKRSILFLGYGYRDPNIRTIMIESQQLLKNNTLDHYMILKAPDTSVKKPAEEEELENRFSHWLRELNRIGINTLTVDSWDNYKRVLRKINLVSKSKRIFATGSHTNPDLSFPFKLGEALSQKNYKLVYGQSEGIGYSVYQGFVQNVIKEKKELNESVHIFANPYSASTEYDDSNEYLPLLRRERQKLIETVGAVLLFAGGKGTRTELEVALENDCIILPCIADAEDTSNPVIKQCLNMDRVINPLIKLAPKYAHNILHSQVPSVTEVLEALQGLL